jgi:hypothetical protein
MQKQTNVLFLPEDLEDAGRTAELVEDDRSALHAVADWIKTFVVKPHPDLGRDGPVCPFMPRAVERKTFWLAPERIADRGVPHIIERMNHYKRLFLDTEPTNGDNANYKVIVVVFTDLRADGARGVFDDILRQIAVPSYLEDGIVFGPFYEGNTGTALYNASFCPFQSPAPFLFVRQGVVSDWKFFLDKEDWFGYWAHRFGESAVHSLGEELRSLPWRERRGQSETLLGSKRATAAGSD